MKGTQDHYVLKSISVGLLGVLGVFGYGAAIPPEAQDRNVLFGPRLTGLPNQSVAKVSGTNASFGFTVRARSTMYEESDPHWDSAWVSYIKVTIGGETAYEWTSSSGSGSMVKFGSVRWDTTHFNDEEDQLEVKVQAKCKVRNGGTISEFSGNSAIVYVDVYNRGFVGQILPRILLDSRTEDAVSAALELMNHSVDVRTDMRQYSCLGSAAERTVFYLNCDGGADESDTWVGELAPNPWAVFSSDLADARDDGSQDGVPPTNYAQFDCNGSGEYLHLAGAFILGYPNPPALYQDKAVVGWAAGMSKHWLRAFNVPLWANYIARYTVRSAVEQAYGKLKKYAITDDPDDWIPNCPDEWQDALAIYGDEAARLYGLYTGSDAQSDTWFEVTVGDGLP